MLPEKHVDRILNKLCIKLGFCLPPEDWERICKEPPPDVLSFTDTVIKAEGLNPDTMDQHLYGQVSDLVAAAFWEHGEPFNRERP